MRASRSGSKAERERRDAFAVCVRDWMASTSAALS